MKRGELRLNDLDLAVANVEEVLIWLVNPKPNFRTALGRIRTLRPDLIPRLLASWRDHNAITTSRDTVAMLKSMGLKLEPFDHTKDGKPIPAWRVAGGLYE